MNEELFDEIHHFINGKTQKEKILSEEEVEYLILSLAESRGVEGFTDEDAWEVVNWAQNARLSAAMLNLVLSGAANINWNGDDVTFKITEEGKLAVDRYQEEA